MLRKIILVLVLAVPVALTPAAVVGATANNKPTTIGGVITDNNKPVKNSAVSLACSKWGHTKFLGNTHTDAKGHYATHANTAQCPAGSQLVARADKNGNGKFEPSEIGISIGVVLNNSSGNVINIIINVHNTSVPEFGSIAAIAAVAIAFGGLLLARRSGLLLSSQLTG